MTNILIIDDSMTERALARHLLEDAAFRVEEAATVEDGLAVLHRAMPDCIVLDLVLPGGPSGFDTLRAMRRLHPRLPPVVVLTGNNAPGIRRYALHTIQVEGFVEKRTINTPHDGLVDQVRAALGQ